MRGLGSVLSGTTTVHWLLLLGSIEQMGLAVMRWSIMLLDDSVDEDSETEQFDRADLYRVNQSALIS